MSENHQELIETLSPLERKIIPYLNLDVKQIKEKSKLDEPSLFRALKFLENKEILKISSEKTKIIDLGTNGIFYKKNHLPERVLLSAVEKNNSLSLSEASKISKLSDNEFKVSLGILKNKNLIEIKNGKLFICTSKEHLSKKTLEEIFLDNLPLEESSLTEDQKYAFEVLKKRKELIEIKEKNTISFQLTKLGESLAGKEIKVDLIEEVTPEIIKDWKRGKKFRKYDLESNVPKINGGKKHFVNQSIEYAKKIWTDLGFEEMTGPMVETSFWNFDALFTPQDHPAREMQDTFFIKDMEGKLPDKELVKAVKTAHESGVDKSKGWQYAWNEKDAKKVLLRTHTTALSAKKLATLKEKDIPAKYFAVGKVFRNETLDWKHAFEFNQTEGIVIDDSVNFRHLLGYLKEFYHKMGFEKIKFYPTFYAFTEPSVEIQVWHTERKEWMELGGAGIFRPEVTSSLFGKSIKVLAWGPGFDRIIMDYYKMKDLRESYSNDIKSLRDKKNWIK